MIADPMFLLPDSVFQLAVSLAVSCTQAECIGVQAAEKAMCLTWTPIPIGRLRMFDRRAVSTG